MELGPQNHNEDGLLGPNSIIVVYMDPLGKWTPILVSEEADEVMGTTMYFFEKSRTEDEIGLQRKHHKAAPYKAIGHRPFTYPLNPYRTYQTL